MFLTKKSPEKSQATVKNIITVNAYADKYYQFKSGNFNPLSKLTYNTSNFVSSYLNNKDMITAVVYISRSIPEEDIADVIDIKAYEELGLDQASDYIISSIESESSGEEREFHIFVSEPEVMHTLYHPIKEQTKYIDLIVPAPLLYKALYNKEIVSSRGVHCYVYFTRQDAFVTLYRDGEFLYAKSIEFSLEQIYDKFCELAGENVDEKVFFTMLESEGLKTTKYEDQQNLIKIFGEIFITINDIIVYAKRAFHIDNIDKIYIGSVNGPIAGLDEYSQSYLGLESIDLNFDYHIKNDEWYTDQLQSLLLLSTFDYHENESSIVNLTMFHRAPSFTKRASGQFIMATAAATIIGLAWPLSYLVGAYMDDAKTSLLTVKKDTLKEESDKYKKILGNKKEKIDVLDKKIAELSNRYSGKTKTLTSIYDKKVNYRLKSGTLYNLAEDLTHNDVNVDMLVTKNDILSLSLVSPDDRKITELIEYISDTHFDDINGIDIRRIEKDKNNGYYKGLLKVDLR